MMDDDEEMAFLQDDPYRATIEASQAARGTVHSGVDNMAGTIFTQGSSVGPAVPAREFDPFEGFILFFDYISQMFSSFNQARIVYSIHNSGERAPIFEPVVLGRAEITQDR